jgi:hypothetical protein
MYKQTLKQWISERESSCGGFVSGSHRTKCDKVIFFKHHRQWPTLASSSQLSTGVAVVHAAFAEPEGHRRCVDQSCTQRLQLLPPKTVFLLEVCPETSKAHDGPRSSDLGSPYCLVAQLASIFPETKIIALPSLLLHRGGFS